MKTTDHDMSRESIAGCLYLRARPVARALAEIGVAAALAMPAPMALAAEVSVPILAREAVRTTTAHSRSEGLLNDAKGIAVSTATKRQKTASYGVELYDTYFSPNQRLVGQKSTLHLYFSNAGGQGYGSFDFDAKTLALPSGVVVASPVVTGNSCGGTLAPAAGATSIAFPAFTMTDDDTCYFGVEVTATAAGAKRLQPTFTGVFDDGGPSLVTVVSSDEATLSVTGAAVSFSPTSVSPGQSATLTLTFVNGNPYDDLNVTGGQIGLGSLTVSGGVSSSNCSIDSAPSVVGGVLQVPGLWVDREESCTVSVSVSASSAGNYQVPQPPPATSLNGSYGCGPSCDFFAFGKTGFSIPVSAATLAVQSVAPSAPILSLPTAPIAFPATAVGSTSAPVALVVTNSGNAPLTISGIAGGGGVFVVASGCPSSPATLAPGATCTLNLTFKPTVPGLQNGTVTIQSDGGSLAVLLSGTGIPGSPAVSWSFSPASVAAAAPASLQLSITNPNAAAFTSTGFSQSLPSGLVIAATPNVSNPASPCAGTIAPPAAGATSFTVNGLSVPASGSCNFSVNVSSAAPGTYGLSTAAGAISGSVAAVAVSSAASNTASLTVAAAPGPTVTKSFSPGSVVAGANSTLTVSLANPNAVPITSLAFTDTFPPGLASSGTAANNCGGAASGGTALSLSGGLLQANGGCEVSIPVSAATAGSYTNTVAVGAATGLVGTSAVANAAVASAVLEVTPAPAPGVAFSPGSLNFGTVTVNSVSGAQRATITNSGTTPLDFSGAFGTSAQFSHVSNCPASLAPTQGCTVDLTFAPTVVGPASGSLTVASNAPGSPHSLPLTGTGDPLPVPGVSFSPASLGFAGQTVATTSSPQGLTLANSGREPLAISGIGTGGDFAQSNNCPASLAPGAGCAINVTFTPLVAGTRTGSLTVASNAPGSPHAAGLTGLGVAIPAPTVSVSPSSLAFPATQLGTTSGTLLVQVRNTGNAPLVVSGVDIVGAGFTLTSNSCNVAVAAGGECAIGIVFAPPALGPASATLRIAGNTPGGPSFVGLAGTGIPVPVATLAATPGSLVFAERVVGTPSAVQVVAISNTGTVAAALGGIGISGDFAATTTCGTSLAAGASCAASVIFTPTAVGERSGALAIVDTAANPLATVTLSGRGAPLPVPVIEVSATSITFGNTTMPGASAPQSFTVRNAGGAPLTITSLAVTGDFVANGCSTPLAAGADCRVDVTFVPHVPGQRPGGISIVSNAANGTPGVSLAGTGCRLNFRTFALVCQ